MHDDGQTKSTHGQTTLEDMDAAKLAIVIFAKDEEKNIAQILRSLASQTLIAQNDVALTIYVVANGCTDRTVEFAREAAAELDDRWNGKAEILDWEAAGKSRSWNRFIHEILPSDVTRLIALDADIEFVDDSVLALMVNLMRDTPSLHVVSGAPIKDSVRKSRRSLVNRFSMNVSNLASYSQSICGQLYLAKASCLREIWLPDETPGEDGFLNAMVRTRGFSRPYQSDVMMQMAGATHYFEDHSVMNFFKHETRMIVGTMINRWIFEYLNSLKLSEPAGPLIEKLNRDQPDWVDRMVEKESAKRWLIPNDLLFRRLQPKSGINSTYLLHLPVLCLATVLTFPPAITANRALKRRGAAAIW